MIPVALCLLICLINFNGTAPIIAVQGLDDGAAPPSEVAVFQPALHCHLYAVPNVCW